MCLPLHIGIVVGHVQSNLSRRHTCVSELMQYVHVLRIHHKQVFFRASFIGEVGCAGWYGTSQTSTGGEMSCAYLESNEGRCHAIATGTTYLPVIGLRAVTSYGPHGTTTRKMLAVLCRRMRAPRLGASRPSIWGCIKHHCRCSLYYYIYAHDVRLGCSSTCPERFAAPQVLILSSRMGGDSIT